MWGTEYYYSQFSLFDLPKLAQSHQIPLVEMNDFMLPPPRFSRIVRPLLWSIPSLPADTWRYRTRSLYQIKENLAAHQSRCLCWTINSDFTRPSRANLAQWYYRSWGIEAAKLLETRFLRFILGGSNESKLSPSEIEIVAQRIARFVRHAHQQLPELTLLIENHWGVSSNIDQFLTIFKKANENLSAAEQAIFGICLDPLNIPKRENLQIAWQKMVPYAKHVHLKETNADGEAIDLLPFVHLLKQAGYDGYWVIEDKSLLKTL